MNGSTERVLDHVMADCAMREAGCRMSAHHFHSYYELFFVEQGSVHFLIGGGSYELNQADILLIPPRTFHCTQYPDKRCVRSVIYFRSLDRIVSPAFTIWPSPAGTTFDQNHFQRAGSVRRTLYSA